MRDRLTPENAVHSAAQLPMVVRGLFFEGWRMSRQRAKTQSMPSATIITHPGAHEPGTSVFEFKRTIDVVEPTGPDTMPVFTPGGSEAIGRIRSDTTVTAGAPYRFQVNMEKASSSIQRSNGSCRSNRSFG